MKIKVLLISLIIVIFSSCTKEQTEPTIDIPVNNEMLVFNSMEDYNAVINKTISLNHDELKVYEESLGFKSFGRKCEEIYYSINPDQFNSFEEIKEYVEKHSEYLVLLKDENDEYTVEYSLYNNPTRYIVNENKMYQLGENVFKVFEKDYAYTNIANIEELFHLDEKDLITTKIDPKITIVHNILTIETKDVANNCGAGEFEKNRYSTSGKHRIKLYITAHQPSAGGGCITCKSIFFSKALQKNSLCLVWNKQKYYHG